MALVAPGLVAPVGRRLVGGSHLGVGVGPEPSEDLNGLQVLSLVAALEVAQTSRCPDVAEVTAADEFEDHVVLLSSLHADGVHAAQAALVTGLQPVDLPALQVGMVLVPGEEVPVVSELPLLGSGSAEFGVRKGEKPSSTISRFVVAFDVVALVLVAEAAIALAAVALALVALAAVTVSSLGRGEDHVHA